MNIVHCFKRKIIYPTSKGKKGGVDVLSEYYELIKSELMNAITIVGYILILHTLITTILSEIIGTLLNFKDKRTNKSKKSDKCSKK